MCLIHLLFMWCRKKHNIWINNRTFYMNISATHFTFYYHAQIHQRTTIYQLYIMVANAINIVYIHVIKYNRCMYNVNSQASACEIEMRAGVWEIRLCAVFVWCANLFGSFALSSSFPSSLYLSFCFSSALVSVCACVCVCACVLGQSNLNALKSQMHTISRANEIQLLLYEKRFVRSFSRI